MSLTLPTIRATKPRREDLPKNANLCEYCTAKCCRYFALPIDTPQSFDDFEYIRWYLLHEAATVFVEEENWFLLVHTVCKHLQEDNRCGIYETRPHICREYTTDICEYEDEWTYEQYFETPEQISEYCEVLFAPGPGDSFRSLKPDPLLVLN